MRINAYIQQIPASNYCYEYQVGILTRSLPVIYLSSVKANDTSVRFKRTVRKGLHGFILQIIGMIC